MTIPLPETPRPQDLTYIFQKHDTSYRALALITVAQITSRNWPTNDHPPTRNTPAPGPYQYLSKGRHPITVLASHTHNPPPTNG